jgi:nucleotide-binding universal stress UspA family protein
MMKPFKVLVALDESAPAFRALQWAAKRAVRALDDIAVLSVLDTRVVLLEARSGAVHSQVQSTLGERLNHTQQQAAQFARGCGIEVQLVLRPSQDPAGEIVRFAREGGFDEIVIGHRDKRGVEKIVLGSTALRVLELADVPVTIVR